MCSLLLSSLRFLGAWLHLFFTRTSYNENIARSGRGRNESRSQKPSPGEGFDAAGGGRARCNMTGTCVHGV